MDYKYDFEETLCLDFGQLAKWDKAWGVLVGDFHSFT
jgi:hypothetical protein